MQRESYRNPQIAQMLNRDFLPVKVDRELQPALDETLMDFVQKTQGRGGWPLNVFLTPEGYPLYAVLYLPPDSFAKVIRQLDAIWREDSEHLTAMVRPAGTDDFPDSAGQVDPAQVASLGQSFEKMALAFADTFEGGLVISRAFHTCRNWNICWTAISTGPVRRCVRFWKARSTRWLGAACATILMEGSFVIP
jgi:uncharacterized protein YyaL (SSP411 family)